MGAWGIGVFDNDSVGDWVIDLLESDNLELIDESIQQTLEDDDIDADTASIAIGAAEILLALQLTSKRDQNLKEVRAWEYDELDEWIDNQKGQGSGLLAAAQQALRKITTESALLNLRKESDEFENWLATITNLDARLSEAISELNGSES